MKKKRLKMNKNNSTTFNGSDTTGVTYSIPYKNQLINDPIVYCPFCGKHLPTSTDEIKYCSFCGKEIPRTYTSTNAPYIIHWNFSDGTASWPRDGIINPIVIC